MDVIKSNNKNPVMVDVLVIDDVPSLVQEKYNPDKHELFINGLKGTLRRKQEDNKTIRFDVYL